MANSNFVDTIQTNKFHIPEIKSTYICWTVPCPWKLYYELCLFDLLVAGTQRFWASHLKHQSFPKLEQTFRLAWGIDSTIQSCYANRNGHTCSWVSGISEPEPQLNSKLGAQASPLRTCDHSAGRDKPGLKDIESHLMTEKPTKSGHVFEQMFLKTNKPTKIHV